MYICNTVVLKLKQLSSLSKLDYEGYAVVLKKSTGEHKVLCSSDLAQNFVDLEEEKNCPIEEKFFQFICG